MNAYNETKRDSFGKIVTQYQSPTNMRSVKSIVHEVERMNLDINTQNKQLKDILGFLNRNIAENKLKTERK